MKVCEGGTFFNKGTRKRYLYCEDGIQKDKNLDLRAETQGVGDSYGSYKTWKVVEFYNFIFQAWCGSWKVIENQSTF